MTDDAPHRPESTGRLPALDAVRGIAIILVLIGHYLPERVVDGLAAAIVQPFALGGVTLFFMLSGFLIERHLAHDNNLIRYGLRRVLRIWPAYLVCLAVIFLLDTVMTGRAAWGVRDVVGNAFLLQDVLGASLMSGVFWTLLVETKFYAVVPFVMRSGARVTRAAPYIVIALNAAVFMRRGEASNLLTFMTFCFVGMQFGPWRRGQLSTPALTALIAITAVTSGFFTNYFSVGVGIFVVIDAALIAIALRAPFTAAPLPFVGTVSYSWYLYHAAIGYPLMTWLAVLLRDSPLPAVAASVVAGVFVTFGVAWVSYRFVETAGLRLGREIERRLKHHGLAGKAADGR